jgi:hypothetical protein
VFLVLTARAPSFAGRLVGILAWILFEFVAGIAGELLFEFGRVLLDRRLLADLFRELSFLFFGVLLGGGSVWLLPQRIFAPGPVPGASLVVGTLAAGAMAAIWGAYQRNRGHLPSGLASWHAGSQIGFGMTLVRYLAFLH